MISLIFFVGFWCLGGLLAIAIALEAQEKYHARYEAPFLPVCEWELMRLENFQLAAELAVAAGTVDEVTAEDVGAYLARYRRGMDLDVLGEYEELYFRPQLWAGKLTLHLLREK
jgi:hypothetical protein